MTASVKTSGSQTATISTEHTLATVTDAGTYQLSIDLTNMADGTTPDIVTIKKYIKTRSGDAEVLSEAWEFIGAQGKPGWRDNPELVASPYIRWSLTQSQGTGRAFPWAVNQA